MVTTFALTACLAAAGGRDRAEKQPLIPVLMGAKLAFDAVTTLQLAGEEWQDNKALCFYCQTVSPGTYISLILAIPEVVRGLDRLRDGR